jgi:hypothetical protein
MNRMLRRMGTAVVIASAGGLFALTGNAYAEDVSLAGDHEVPPVKSSGSAKGTVTVGADKSVKADITVTGFTPTAAHIHQGAAGANGPVVVPFTKSGDNKFVAAPDAKLTDAQYEAYKKGDLYVNVHSAANPGGEVRAQLKGK